MSVSGGSGASSEGGRGGVVTLSGGSSLGETGCVLTEYNCSGVIVPSTVYEAVKRGCTRDCSFYGADTHTFMWRHDAGERG